MAILRTVKPIGLIKKISTISVLSVIVVFALSLALARNGVPLGRMFLFIGLCTLPAIIFIIARINKNKLTIFDDHFESIQGMSSISVTYSEVKSVSIEKRPFQSPMGPTAVSVPMLVFTTKQEEIGLIISEYRHNDIYVLLNALILTNPESNISKGTQ